MTTPETPIAPEVATDPLMETISGAVVASQESPCVMRIGVVTQLIEGTQITVKISASEVLVDCSYLFFQYFPVLGDRVIILKQDSQWICLGQPSGAIGANNPLPNSSFEDGAIGVIPTGWSINVLSSGGGTPTFLVASPSSVNISGTQVVDFGTDSVGAGTSSADVFSPTIIAGPDSKWTGAYYLSRVFIGTPAPKFSSLEYWIQFLGGTGTVISEFMINRVSFLADSVPPVYRRINLTTFPAGFVTAPGGTVSVRARFRGDFDLDAASFVSFFMDNVILRQVD